MPQIVKKRDREGPEAEGTDAAKRSKHEPDDIGNLPSARTDGAIDKNSHCSAQRNTSPVEATIENSTAPDSEAPLLVRSLGILGQTLPAEICNVIVNYTLREDCPIPVPVRSIGASPRQDPKYFNDYLCTQNCANPRKLGIRRRGHRAGSKWFSGGNAPGLLRTNITIAKCYVRQHFELNSFAFNVSEWSQIKEKLASEHWDTCIDKDAQKFVRKVCFAQYPVDNARRSGLEWRVVPLILQRFEALDKVVFDLRVPPNCDCWSAPGQVELETKEAFHELICLCQGKSSRRLQVYIKHKTLERAVGDMVDWFECAMLKAISDQKPQLGQPVTVVGEKLGYIHQSRNVFTQTTERSKLTLPEYIRRTFQDPESIISELATQP